MNRVIITGKACSGKDFLKNKFIKKGFLNSVSHTTRPMRENEIDGKDYHFVKSEEFLEMVDNNLLREHNVFTELNWYYGVTNESFNNATVFIMTPSGINKLTKEERDNSFVIYLDVPVEVRRERILKRTDIDDPERRLAADEKDFENFSDYDMRVTNCDW